ncbi:MAG: Riboflavin kinase, partial [Deltaproteobacteria bacterium]|nr:Riboflavin kinase [Deltaproteobacteria bacterium]
HFIDRIRDEKAFPDIHALREQIKRDIERAREIVKTKKYPKLR